MAARLYPPGVQASDARAERIDTLFAVIVLRETLADRRGGFIVRNDDSDDIELMRRLGANMSDLKAAYIKASALVDKVLEEDGITPPPPLNISFQDFPDDSEDSEDESEDSED